MKMANNANNIFFNELEFVQKQYKKYVQQNLIKHGMTITFDQWLVLDIIVNNKGIKQTEIAQKTSKDTASVTRIIELLNKKGYVARQVDPNNRRKQILGVSNMGEKEFIKAGKIINDCSDMALKGLKEKRLRKLRKVFKNIIKNSR